MLHIQSGTLHHLWVAPVKKVEKRDVVLIEYDSLDKAAFLFEKMESLSFSLDDNLTILDIIEKVQAAFLINSEKITKSIATLLNLLLVLMTILMKRRIRTNSGMLLSCSTD